MAVSERSQAVWMHALFSSWMLALLFQGQVFEELAQKQGFVEDTLVLLSTGAMFAGLFLGGFFVEDQHQARRYLLWTYPYFAIVSLVFFWTPTVMWNLAMLSAAFLAGSSVAAWGFYFKKIAPREERIQTAADVLIWSNILMVFFNLVAIHLSPYLGLGLSMLALLGAFGLAKKMPVEDGGEEIDEGQRNGGEKTGDGRNLWSVPPIFYTFIVILSINSGLTYRVIIPAYEHLRIFTSWYWAVPYIVAVAILRSLSTKIKSFYILYVAIAMIGLSFTSFLALKPTLGGYFLVNTLMLGSYGVYDLFFWSILGLLLDDGRNSAKIMGIGLSANVLGIFLGSFLGDWLVEGGSINPSLLAFAVVCVILMLLPPLNKQLSALLGAGFYGDNVGEEGTEALDPTEEEVGIFVDLTEREQQVAQLLLQGKTYKAIAVELDISENTVKYYVKNTYAKLQVNSRGALIELVERERRGKV